MNQATSKCLYCGQPVKEIANSHGFKCAEHERMWDEDRAGGFQQNRLRELIQDPDSYYNQHKDF